MIFLEKFVQMLIGDQLNKKTIIIVASQGSGAGTLLEMVGKSINQHSNIDMHMPSLEDGIYKPIEIVQDKRALYVTSDDSGVMWNRIFDSYTINDVLVYSIYSDPSRDTISLTKNTLIVDESVSKYPKRLEINIFNSEPKNEIKMESKRIPLPENTFEKIAQLGKEHKISGGKIQVASKILEMSINSMYDQFIHKKAQDHIMILSPEDEVFSRGMVYNHVTLEYGINKLTASAESCIVEGIMLAYEKHKSFNENDIEAIFLDFKKHHEALFNVLDNKLMTAHTKWQYVFGVVSKTLAHINKLDVNVSDCDIS